jgi:membrane protein
MPDVEQPREHAQAARDRAEGAKERAEQVVPGTWLEAARSASARNLAVLSAGLAFFGLISIGPAIGVVFGMLQLVVGAEAVEAIVELLEDTPVDQFGLVDIMRDMEDRAGQFAGFGALFLLWPATTLASGWARALNGIFGLESQGPAGLKGRLRGIVPGAVVIASVFLLFVALSLGTALIGEQALLAVIVLPGAIAVQGALILVIYRYLPSERFPWRDLWRGAALATAGSVLATAGLALVLTVSGDVTEDYPEQLTTAIVLGFWLYALNTALLLGAEYNGVRRRRAQHGDEPVDG